ncbi:PfkB family carbohydrate kinase [Limosilactobacillus mucosae]|uniref:PfkB family carbohydrate kinase n=1 Tax=uncultured Limosilactobacillus sp. TaxID=2837629 RepID=UPI00242EA1EF|nr:PfkB family carbohydrate kinase [Limosilactobacillus mucosae]
MVEKSLVIGAAFVDVIMDVGHLPTSGSDVTANLKSYNVGGCAFNVYGAIRHYLGADRVDLFVPVGKGQYSEMIRKTMNSSKIPILAEDDCQDNGWDICLIEPSGERTFITIPGIEQNWQAEWFNKIDLSDYKYFYVSGYEMENAESAKLLLDYLAQRNADSYIIFDASPRINYIDFEILDRLLSKGVIINANENEIGFLSDKDTLAEKAQDIFCKTNEPVLITLGARGTYLYDKHGGKIIGTDKVKNIVNTIGAGDTHCGGVIAGLLEGNSFPKVCQIGNELAAQVIQQEPGYLS